MEGVSFPRTMHASPFATNVWRTVGGRGWGVRGVEGGGREEGKRGWKWGRCDGMWCQSGDGNARNLVLEMSAKADTTGPSHPCRDSLPFMVARDEVKGPCACAPPFIVRARRGDQAEPPPRVIESAPSLRASGAASPPSGGSHSGGRPASKLPGREGRQTARTLSPCSGRKLRLEGGRRERGAVACWMGCAKCPTRTHPTWALPLHSSRPLAW